MESGLGSRNFPKDITNNNSNGGNSSSSGCKTPSNSSKNSAARKSSIVDRKTPGSASRALGHNTTNSKRNSKTPSKTPSNTPSRTSKLTPSRNSNVNKTPGGGDRFIPNRGASQFEVGYYMLTSQSSQNESQLNSTNTENSAPPSPNRAEYQRIMSENLNGGLTCPSASNSQNESANSNASLNVTAAVAEGKCRILAYQKGKAPLAPQGHTNLNRVLYTARATPASSCKKSMRHIPSAPDRILDAPEIMDDYYLNLVDWNLNNIMAVGLAGQVYLWNATTSDINLLHELESTTDYISSVSWVKEGHFLAVGLNTGEVQESSVIYMQNFKNVKIWDVDAQRRLRNMAGHSQRVGSLSWNSFTLSSGSRSGEIHHHDVRVQQHLVAESVGHTQEVCGLKWSPDSRYLASGGNDNLLNVWPQVNTQAVPVYTFAEHQAAVKVSGILWSAQYKEIISGHGYPSNQLSIWKYGQTPMPKVTDLVGHTARVLHMAMSPCGEYVISAAADESLRLWRCFGVDASQKKKQDSKQQLSTRKGTAGTMNTRLR